MAAGSTMKVVDLELAPAEEQVVSVDQAGMEPEDALAVRQDPQTQTKGEPHVVQAIQLTAPVDIRLDQLDEEITRGEGLRKQVGITIDGDPATASKEAPVHVYIERDEAVDIKAVHAYLKSHQADWTKIVKGQEAPTLDEVKEKLANDQMLTPAETQVALKSLLSN